MLRPRAILPQLAIALALGVQITWASVIPKLTFEQILHTADMVFTGTVVRVESKWTPTRSGPAIITLVIYRVERVFKGTPDSETTLEFLGGTVGDVTLEVIGVPTFVKGQHDVICAFAGGLRVSPLAGFNQGRFRVTRDGASGQEIVRGDEDPSTRLAGPAVRGLSTLPAPMTLAAFEQEVVRVLHTLPR
jgi:hypothetical protein